MVLQTKRFYIIATGNINSLITYLQWGSKVYTYTKFHLNMLYSYKMFVNIDVLKNVRHWNILRVNKHNEVAMKWKLR